MQSWKAVKSLIILSRPVNVIIAFLSIWLAGYLCGIDNNWTELLLASISGALVTAGANAINDYYDLEIDRINKPFRPLPSGSILPHHAVLFAAISFSGALLAALCINLTAVVIASVSTVFLYWYSARLKRTVLWGNLTVSFITGLAFVYGGIAVGRVEYALIPAVFAFFMHFGREIVKDMEDVSGDQAQGARTLPVAHGLRPAQWLVTALFGLLIAATLVPYYAGIYGVHYLIVVVAGVNLVLIAVIAAIWKRPTPATFRVSSALLKADMPIGLLAIYLGR